MSTPSRFPELEELHNQLSLALGEAIWAFSKVESLTYDYLRVLSTEPLHELMDGQSFASRCKLAERLVSRIEGREAEKVRALAALKRALSLANNRNRIAHNPWRIWIDFCKRDLQAGIFHSVRQGDVEVTPEFVRKFATDAQGAATELDDALRALWDAQ